MSELKILICDDDPDLQGLLVRRLQKMGIEPDVAGDGRVAKAFVEQNNYDLIVTDIYMPEATGLEVLQYAKTLDEDTQVVIITSSATLDNAVDALNHGAFGYLTKPFDHLIVFDNMVSRALEYRGLLIGAKHKVEAQKRRGDMLEDEVAQRVQQLQKKQKGLIDLLGSLPDGILVIEEGGKVVLSSPVGERWLARDERSKDGPIRAFITLVHSQQDQATLEVELDGSRLQLMAAAFADDGDVKRKAVIIREIEENGIGAGSMVTETVMGIKQGLAALYEQGVGTEVVLDLANQFAILEQLAGWSGGTGELVPPQAPAPAPASGTSEMVQAGPAPAAPAPATPAPIAAETPAPAPEAPAPIAAETPAPAPEAPAPIAAETPAPVEEAPLPEDSPAEVTQPGAKSADDITSIPPFALPRERVATGELGGPRMNTGELQQALMAAIDPAQEPAEPVAQAPTESQPAAGPPAEVEAPAHAAPSPPAEPPPADAPAAPQGEAEDSLAVAPWMSGEPVIEQDFPASQTDRLEDDSMYKPRVIPESIDAKLETPLELTRTNGKQEDFPKNVHDGPLTIQAKSADTEVFRNVLEGLSGTQILSLGGKKSAPAETTAKKKAKPKPQEPREQPPPPAPEEELHATLQSEPEPEPKPEPQPAGTWPPTLPTKDEDWSDELETSE